MISIRKVKDDGKEEEVVEQEFLLVIEEKGKKSTFPFPNLTNWHASYKRFLIFQTKKKELG